MKRKDGSMRGQRPRGFTLVEQVMVTALVATLACMAAPALGSLMRRSQLQAAQMDIIAALQATRGMAVHTRTRAMLCPSRDGQRCSGDLHWENGWLIGHYRSDHGDQLDGPPLLIGNGHAQVTILSTVGRRRVRFQMDGSSGGSNVSFTLCRTGHADNALAVTVANSGRIFGSAASEEQAARCANGG